MGDNAFFDAELLNNFLPGVEVQAEDGLVLLYALGLGLMWRIRRCMV
jgi:hypothetical protein